MGSYRRDRHTVSRNSAGSTTERAPAAALRRFERPCQIRHQDAVKIPGRERYITDSRIAAKPSSAFTIHACQAFQASVLGEMLQTRQIELQNNLHSALFESATLRYFVRRRRAARVSWSTATGAGRNASNIKRKT